MKWTERQRRVRTERFAEALRECGLLWLVFSNLDRLLGDSLTFLWFAANTMMGLVLWALGTYIEMKEVTRIEP